MGWARLNGLLDLWSHWSEDNLKLIRNNRPIAADLYMDEVPQGDAPVRRASLAKVEALLATGASLVANRVQSVSLEVRQATEMLAERFAGIGNANLYCSFEGIQAFHTHYDRHEVFAVQCEGEKTWRIYENRAEPVERAFGSEEVQRQIAQARGDILLEARMRPGDLLYIPRGFYHEAVASSPESLHLTLSVMPLSGRFFLKILKEAALREPLLTQYLPDAREGDGEGLREHLDRLAGRLGEIVRSQAFFDSVAEMQAKLSRPAQSLTLPERPRLQSYARTARDASVEHRDQGALLLDGSPAPLPLGRLAGEVEWILGRTLFSVQELFARFPHHDREEIRALLDRLVERNIVKPASVRA